MRLNDVRLWWIASSVLILVAIIFLLISYFSSGDPTLVSTNYTVETKKFAVEGLNSLSIDSKKKMTLYTVTYPSKNQILKVFSLIDNDKSIYCGKDYCEWMGDTGEFMTYKDGGFLDILLFDSKLKINSKIDPFKDFSRIYLKDFSVSNRIECVANKVDDKNIVRKCYIDSVPIVDRYSTESEVAILNDDGKLIRIKMNIIDLDKDGEYPMLMLSEIDTEGIYIPKSYKEVLQDGTEANIGAGEGSFYDNLEPPSSIEMCNAENVEIVYHRWEVNSVLKLVPSYRLSCIEDITMNGKKIRIYGDYIVRAIKL